MKYDLVLSCEHGGNRVPARYRDVFRGAERELQAHTGWDPGAAELARDLAKALKVPATIETVTRLLIDLNRSAEHPKRFSRFSDRLPLEERERLVETYWQPHRRTIEERVRASGRRSTLHLSVHSFTPRWKEVTRTVDVGWLYDPSRERECEVVDAGIAELKRRRPDLRVYRNRPYRGTSDGLTSCLRGHFVPARYLGVELEINQRFALGRADRWRELRADLVATLRTVLLD